MIATLICGEPDGQSFSGVGTFPLLGRPLMSYAVLAARHAAQVDRVFLSTTSEEMRRIGAAIGADSIAREGAALDKEAPLTGVFLQGCTAVRAALGEEPEAFVLLLGNAPTITAGMIDKAVEMLRAGDWDGVISVSPRPEFHPRFALRIGTDHRLLASPEAPYNRDAVYFPDALLWVVRPRALAGVRGDSEWLFDFSRHRVAALVHEGYGDVDHPWQIPAIEEWLKRAGFSEKATPYDPKEMAAAISLPPPREGDRSRRVLVTTVPFGNHDREPLRLLEEAGIDFVVNPLGRRLREDELAGMAADFGILVAGTEPITARVLERAPHLRLVSRVGIGLDNVDLAAAARLGIAVAHTPDAPSPAVAELTLGLILNLLRHISQCDRGMRHGVWYRFLGRRLDGLCVGVVGVGRIGERVIRLLRGAFPGLRILADDPARKTGLAEELRFDWATKEQIVRESDVVTLHCPLTPETRGWIGRETLGRMKPDALLVNTARGEIVVEADLARALRERTIAGAAIDVYEQEPYSGELATLESCLLTSHIGSMTRDCRTRMEIEAVEEALRHLRGEPLRNPAPIPR